MAPRTVGRKQRAAAAAGPLNMAGPACSPLSLLVMMLALGVNHSAHVTGARDNAAIAATSSWDGIITHSGLLLLLTR